MHTDTLRSFLEKDYSGIDKFLEQVIYRIFDKTELDPINKDDLADEENNIKLAHDTGIGRMELIGKIFVSGAWLRIYDVTVDSSVRMAHNRVNLQRLTRRIMHHNSAAFMLFHYDEAHATDREWRFSFCYKSSESEQTTDPKRFTFLFGRGHSSRTAAENFQKLFDKKGQEVTIADIREAFSVEALSKEFFDKYREHYARFVLHATGKRYVKQANKWEERTEHAPDEAIMQAFGGDEKRVRDYVKKLLGRIVFLHFLQKKGWMGVPDGGSWGEGKFRFMYKLFEEATAEQRADFVHEVLEHLFFHALNTDRKADNDLYDTRVFDEKVRVPYLNGGLFEEDDADRCFKACTDARFPTELFRDLFAFFEQYNFTIDENDPDDAQVGVDPEMLGRIFESLLEDNKEKGAFYTPKEIVQYMCRRSLTAYLQADVPDERMRRAIDEFVRTKDDDCLHVQDDVSDERQPSPLRQQIAERLRTVKICDPAIGSGAFPMGLLRELYLCRIALEDGVRENRAKSHADIKLEILRDNVYGVDLERGAVDIARLRFWLSLVVDEEEPQPLPNLDYKIMQGNSLLERYKDIDLSTLASQKTDGRLVFIDDENDASRLSLHYLLVAYYGEDNHDKKLALRARIQQKIEEHVKAQGYEVDLSDVDLFANPNFFLWHTWFSEVFSRPTKEGFDIVIGNPPYGAKLSDEDKRTFKKTYRSAQTIKGRQKGSLDTYSLFIEQGYNLSHRNGICAFIVPMGITSSEAMTGLHHILLAGSENIEVSSYGDRPRRIFDSAEQQVSIILFRKGRNDALTISTTSINKRNASQSIDAMIEKLSFTQIEIAHIRNGRIPKLGSDTEGQILRKMLSHTVTFGDFFLSEGAPVYYRKAGGRYYKVITITPTNSSAEGALIVPPAYQKTFAAIMSSSLFYWFWLTHSDWHNLRLLEIAWFPLPHLSDEILSLANRLYDEYQEDLLAKSQLTTTGLRCYYARKSKTFIDRIDDLICPLYGLTKEETEFIKNYEIEFRLGEES